MGETVTFPSDSGTGRGYLAVPDSVAGTAPAVVVLHEWWATDSHVRAVADRFAAAGVTALVPDLYRGLRATEPDPARRLLMGLAMDAAADEVAAAARFLTSRAPGAPVGTVGFRTGGSLALWSAACAEEITLAVAFYPTLPWERMAAKWDGFHGCRAMVHTAAGQSGGPGAETARQAVEKAGGDWLEYEYPDAPDGFFNDDRPACYDRDAAALSWARSLEALRSAPTLAA